MRDKKNKKHTISAESMSRRVFLVASTIFLATFFLLPLSVSAEGASNVTSDKGQQTVSQGFSGSGKLDYIPLEEIPGLIKTGDLPTYIVGIYKFGIWVVGIAALLMISIGGFMYVTSAGNNAAMGKAKGVITDAIIGLIMALTAWLLLNTINPDLLKIKLAAVSSGGNASNTVASTNGTNTNDSTQVACMVACETKYKGNQTGIDECKNGCTKSTGNNANYKNQEDCNKYCTGLVEPGQDTSSCYSSCMSAKNASDKAEKQAACEKYWNDWYEGDTSNSDYQTNVASCKSMVTSSAKISDGKCSQIDGAISNNSYNVDPAILKSIMVGGEGCSKKLSYDGKGSCGYSQALPKIRAWCGISGTAEQSCAAIQNDPQLDADCAAKLIKDNEKRCGSDINGVASCYNSGKPNNCANTTSNYCGRVSAYYKNLKS